MLSKATSATQVLSKSNLSRAEKRVKPREASRESCTTGKDQRTFFFFFFSHVYFCLNHDLYQRAVGIKGLVRYSQQVYMQ